MNSSVPRRATCTSSRSPRALRARGRGLCYEHLTRTNEVKFEFSAMHAGPLASEASLVGRLSPQGRATLHLASFGRSVAAVAAYIENEGAPSVSELPAGLLRFRCAWLVVTRKKAPTPAPSFRSQNQCFSIHPSV